MNDIRLYQLLDLYTKKELSSKEQIELNLAIAEPSNEDVIKRWIDERWEREELPGILSKTQSLELYKAVKEEITKNRRNIIRSFVLRTSVAASILIIISIGVYSWFYSNNKKENSIISVKEQAIDIKAPNVTIASIVLANGSVIPIDSLKKGNIRTSEGLEIIKSNDGRLQYLGIAETITYNTLVNPSGSDVVSISLSDGTKVWLNASSKITYPTSFASDERRVELVGEAYFDVAKNEKKPFIVVVSDKLDIKVTGTEFNVKAYSDESSVKTTLVTGSVEIVEKKSQNLSHSIILKPGQQGYTNENGDLVIKNVDINESIAWIKGIFYFLDTDLESIMKCLARWYNVEVIFKNQELKALKFGAVISKRENISVITNLLKMTGTVDFEIAEDKVFVTNAIK